MTEDQIEQVLYFIKWYGSDSIQREDMLMSLNEYLILMEVPLRVTTKYPYEIIKEKT